MTSVLEFMPQKTTITGQTYANKITALREVIKEKRRGKLSAGTQLLHDNVPVHMSAKSQAAIQQCKFQQLNHPPYSPDLAPSDYFLFRVMKKFLRGKRFSSDEDVKKADTTWFQEQSKDFLCRGYSRCNKIGRSVLSYYGTTLKNLFFCDILFLSYSGR